MPVPTPFHPRTAALCHSLFWKEWAGHHAVRSYDVCHEREYYALRHSVALLDVSPLYKYEIRGRDAAELLARVTVRDTRRLKPGRVTYLCWCDDEGKVRDDGTVTRLDTEWFRLTSNHPTAAWLGRQSRGLEVTIEDSSERIGALALQGPNARRLLSELCDVDLSGLRFFRSTRCKLGDVEIELSRTGYTGDLGYELWIPADRALETWDRVVEVGRRYRLAPMGLDALDVSRIEAGFILNGVDYFSAHHCLIASRQSSPFEIGLGWTVRLDREPFVGQAALRREREQGSRWSLVGLRLDWDELEQLYARVGLPPQMPATAWRDAVPVYDTAGKQVGQATSGTWSPILKANLALATVESRLARPGTRLRMEATVEYRREQVTAVVTPTPFFDPERKRA